MFMDKSSPQKTQDQRFEKANAGFVVSQKHYHKWIYFLNLNILILKIILNIKIFQSSSFYF